MIMNTKDALNILTLDSTATESQIDTAYRRACSMYHPDRNPAGLEMMKMVNLAYMALEGYEPTAVKESEPTHYGDALWLALNTLINLNLTVEVCGSWLWVSGNTKPHKDILKTAGFKWAGQKKMWHYRPAEYRSFSRGKWSMDEIRARHGSSVLKGKIQPKVVKTARVASR